jgi:hypothetical protein
MTIVAAFDFEKALSTVVARLAAFAKAPARP